MADLAPSMRRPHRRRASRTRGACAALGLAACLAGGCTDGEAGSAPSTPAPRARNLLLITIDTLRADHLQTYGYERPTSGSLESFGRTATVFERAQASSSWTLPSVASLMTSLHPGTHGCVSTRSQLAPSFPTLATILSEASFATAAWTANMFTSPRYGFDQGFDEFEFIRRSARRMRVRDRHRGSTSTVTSELLTQKAGDWLEARAGAKDPGRWFLWVHYFDPHARYMVHPGLTEMFGRRAPQDLYDGEIAFTDVHVGHLLDQLQRLGFDTDTAVVVAADHGEEFGDHGDHGHRKTLYREVVRVPLMIRVPGVEPRRVDEVVSLVDVLPTALDVLGLPAPDLAEGRSLVPALLAGRLPERPALAQLSLPEKPDLNSVMQGRWKLIGDADGATPQLFDLSTDPAEANDVAADHADEVAHLQATLESLLARALETADRFEAPEPLDLTEEEREQLQALGYAH